MESAQGQSGIPEVTEFCIISNAASDYGLSRGYLACLPFFAFSGSSLEWVVGTAEAVDYSGLYTEDNVHVHDIGGVYGHYLFVPRDLFDNNRPILDGRWIKVSFYVSADPNSSSLSVVVEDSEGNVYTPHDVWISYYGWKGW